MSPIECLELRDKLQAVIESRLLKANSLVNNSSASGNTVMVKKELARVLAEELIREGWVGDVPDPVDELLL